MAKLFKCNWSIRFLFEISEQLLALCTQDLGCGPLDATNASKHSIDQSKGRILLINQSKNASKHKRQASLMHGYCHFADTHKKKRKHSKLINNFLFYYLHYYLMFLYSRMWLADSFTAYVFLRYDRYSRKQFSVRLVITTGWSYLLPRVCIWQADTRSFINY